MAAQESFRIGPKRVKEGLISLEFCQLNSSCTRRIMTFNVSDLYRNDRRGVHGLFNVHSTESTFTWILKWMWWKQNYLHDSLSYTGEFMMMGGRIQQCVNAKAAK